MRRPALLGLVALAILLWGAGAVARAASRPPRLVTVVVVDGLSQAQLARWSDRLGRDGLARLLGRGAWFTNARYGCSATLTGPGHATLLTGAHPYVHGIVANDWMDRATGRRVYCAEDSGHTWLEEESRPHAGTSPRLLRVSTLADELRLATRLRSKVLCASGKDRSAILPAGRLGTAWFYSARSGRYVTSTYYMREVPAWWRSYYDSHPQDRWRGATWEPRDSGGGGEPGAEALPIQLPGGGGGAAAAMAEGSAVESEELSRKYYEALRNTPFADEYTLEFVETAVRGESLGHNRHGVPDLLVVSFSSHDAVNHRHGPESRAALESLLRLDRTLAAFLRFLDDWVGLARVAIVLTADHGFADTPEHLRELGFDAGRIDPGGFVKDLNAALSARFRVPKALAGWWTPTLYLDLGALRAKQVSPAEAADAAAEMLRQRTGIAAVFTRAQLESGCLPDTGLGLHVLRSWDAERSGDLFVVQRPYWCFLRPGGDAATHGSRYTYDANVPLVFAGPWFRPGKHGDAQVADIAPTLSHILGIPAPSGSEGRVLDTILSRARR